MKKTYYNTPAFFLVSAFIILFSCAIFAVPNRVSFSMASEAPISNSIGDIVYDGECIWVSTSEGMSRTCDDGESWEHFLINKSFSAMSYSYGRVLAVSAYDTVSAGDSYPVGEGLYWAYTDSASIEFQKLRPWQMTFIHDTSFYGMLSYDLTVAIDGMDTILWSANWYGGLSYSSDWGQTWRNILWDYAFGTGDSGTVIDTVIPANYNSILSFIGDNGADYARLFFAVTVDTAVDTARVFAGTASGIYVIQDTLFWRAEPDDGLLGRWCVALAVQYLSTGQHIVWASSRSVSEGEGNGVCYSTNGGRTWDTLAVGASEETTTLSLLCWNFAFGCNAVFCLCEQGLFKADIYSTTDSLFIDSLREISITDSATGDHLPVDAMISAVVIDDRIWVGSESGLAYSFDCGTTWHIIFHGSLVEQGQTYAFPSPFSPYVHGALFFVLNSGVGGTVEIKIFDFAIEEVKNLTKTISAGEGQMVQWDGKDNDGKYPSNGIYFYRVKLPDGTELWGKFAMLK